MGKDARDAVLPLAIGLFLPALTLAVSQILNLVPKENLVPAVITLLAIVMFSIGVVHLTTLHLSRREDLLGRRLERLIAERDILPWVVTKGEVYEIEKKAKTFWIITPDFWNDTHVEELQPIVMENVKQGKEYRYLYPPSKAHIANHLKRKCHQCNPDNRVEFKQIPEDAFRFTRFEIVLYDAEDPGSAYHCGFLADVLQSKQGAASIHIDIKLDEEDSLPYFIHVFKDLFDGDDA